MYFIQKQEREKLECRISDIVLATLFIHLGKCSLRNQANHSLRLASPQKAVTCQKPCIHDTSAGLFCFNFQVNITYKHLLNCG